MNILGIDTSDKICKVKLFKEDEDKIFEKEWLADRGLSKGLLRFLEDFLKENHLSFWNVKGLVIFKGPGSYTGLRIGITVFNTYSDTTKIPIVGETGEDWFLKGVKRLERGENDKVVMPKYLAPAHITKQRK
ncbi:MAG: tRNA (adenosine(37)-N6)-threonylcarbamoyltransferase complex dimerization subunit type 1 TsaB [Candidatus Saccharibacteria bacterium]|nr:tRNA (adenosine(37)-N6)-threonylcarbamoyltransferase complex dimerization subunit type 1 TsaB [Candidatus Saccharibacteria bacterium]